MNKVVYHSTSFGRAQQILKDGIKPNDQGFIAVAEQLNYSAGFGIVRASFDKDNAVVVLAIELPETTLTNPDRFGPLPYKRDGKCWRYTKGKIAPSMIKIAAIYEKKIDTKFEDDYKRAKPKTEAQLIASLRDR